MMKTLVEEVTKMKQGTPPIPAAAKRAARPLRTLWMGRGLGRALARSLRRMAPTSTRAMWNA
eukprot:12950478-Heterocapsa_arctica.AAC.1